MMPSRGKGKSINGMFDADRKQLILNDSLLSRNSLSLSNIRAHCSLLSAINQGLFFKFTDKYVLFLTFFFI